MPDILTYPTEVKGAMMENGVNGLHDVTTLQYFALGARYHKKTYAPADCVYRYTKSSGACRAGRGAAFWNTMADGVDWTFLTGDRIIGDKYVEFPAGTTHPAYVKNELCGGSILISDSDVDATDSDPMNRTITGNDVSTLNGALKVYLDTPLSRATSALTYAFLMKNPYDNVRYATDAGMQAAIGGVPAAKVSAADRYFWMQTWGPCWVAFHGDLSTKAGGVLEAVWRWDGSVCTRADAAPFAHTYAQLAGYVIDKGTSATFIHLMVAP